jgi:transposase
MLRRSSFFFLVEEKGMSVRAAAQKLSINVRTTQGWVSKNNKDPQEYIKRSPGSERPIGRPPVLTDEHKNYMIQWADENTDSVVLEDMLDALTEKFGYLQITRSGFYKIAREKCRITFKKAHLQPVERNTPEKIKQRYEWVKRWMETDLDFTSNCVFIDVAAFHINLKRNFSWSKEGSRAVVKVPRTRAKTTTILGAISPFGVMNISVRRPRALGPSKKRKVNGGTKAKESNNSGTVTGHYFNFISSVLDVMDRHEQFRGHYLVMDNAPIHMHEDIQKHIESRGYGCVYLPPYSPELNPIEQFWSVCKSKLKREQLLDEEAPTTRIADACNRVLYSDLQGFCRYSASKFDDCLNRKPS